jgi:transcriptional regulator with XRE-family HTH domain
MHAPLRGGGENVWMNRRRTVGTYIVERRKALGLSQGDLAEALRVTRTLVSRWETDKQRPSADHLDGLARVLEDDGKLASLARYDEGDQSPLFDTPVRVGDLCRRIGDALIAYLSTDVTGPGGEPVYGWRHDLDDPARPPSALASAYGLRAVALAGSLDRRVNLPRVRETIRRLELPTGGWTARRLSAVARPEITAVVAGVLHEAGEDDGFVADRVALVVDLLDRRAPDAELARPYVLATSLIELSRLPLDDVVGRRLVESLVDISQVDAGARGWPVAVRAPGIAPRSLSTVHTAMAVCAIAGWARRLDDPVLGDAARTGLTWLERHAELDLDDEQLTNDTEDGRTELVPVRHFTPAWVVQAAQAAGADSTSALIRRAIREVLRFYFSDVGVWRWPRSGGTYPVWMTHHGVAALKAWATSHEIS